MPTIRPPFPHVIDSSLVSAFRSCRRKGFLEYFEHWKSKGRNVHLHAGGAYAHALERARTCYYIEGLPSSECITKGLKALIEFYGDFECPSDSAKSLERMCGAFEYYFTQYPLETDKAVPITLPGGKRGIEFSFAEPIDASHPVTGDPLLYVGRMDMICEFAGGIFGEDDKTTSQLGASWPKQWDLRSQFTGYCWGAKRANLALTGFLVRGVSILKTKYDTLQAITYRPEWMIERWYEQLIKDVADMKACWESGYWDYNLDHACAEYGGCGFRQICLTEPSNQVQWLETNFERRRWDPVTRTEMRVDKIEMGEWV
jgi:hypothetical protein